MVRVVFNNLRRYYRMYAANFPSSIMFHLSFQQFFQVFQKLGANSPFQRYPSSPMKEHMLTDFRHAFHLVRAAFQIPILPATLLNNPQPTTWKRSSNPGQYQMFPYLYCLASHTERYIVSSVKPFGK